MSLYFIYGNLKVNPFVLSDRPPPGFSLLTWDHESWCIGTLWDIGVDAGYSVIGTTRVHGQLWIPEDSTKIADLEKMCGARNGVTAPIGIEVTVQTEAVVENVEAITFRICRFLENYQIVRDGKWSPKRCELQAI